MIADSFVITRREILLFTSFPIRVSYKSAFHTSDGLEIILNDLTQLIESSQKRVSCSLSPNINSFNDVVLIAAPAIRQ